MQKLITGSLHLRRSPLPELTFWMAALTILFLLDPTGGHISICPLSLTGISWCPGCGLGKSIAYGFNGNLLLSFQAHPLGFFAIVVIFFRIINLFIKAKSYKL